MSIEQALKGERIYCVCIQGAHLNTLVETPFHLTVTASCLNEVTPIGDAVQLNNKTNNVFINVSEHAEKLGEHGVQLNVTDNDTGKRFRFSVEPMAPLVVSIPMKIGDPLVLTIQCIHPQNPHKKTVSGVVHTSFMREASIVQTPGTTARKISLSPRRTTSFDQSAAAVGLLGTGQAIPSTKKTLLFLEDSQLNMKATPNSSIIGGIQCAQEVTADGTVLNPRPIQNFHESFLTDISARVRGEGDKERHVGPHSGAYVVCNSKSEMLVSELGKKTHKKQSLLINLGTLQIAQSTLSGPVRIRAKLVDLNFSHSGSGLDALGNVSSTDVQHEQKAVIAYIGLLEEVSRELFNETGLTACTLEGKLFKPTSLHGSASTAATALEGTHHDAEGEESCVAVKLYVSLVPSRGDADSPEEEASGSDSEHPSKAGSAHPSRRGSKRTLDAENAPGSVHASQHASAHNSVHGSVNNSQHASRRNSDAASVSKSHHGSRDQLPSDAPSVADVQRRIDANEPYNVVTKNTALPDELIGSSSMLAVGPNHLSAAELKALSKSKAGSNLASAVPLLNLGGNASKASSIASMHAPEATEYSEFMPLKPSHGAFGEDLEPSALGRIQPGRHKNAAATGLAFAEIVRGELEQKQRLVEELTEDVRVRNEAIQVCGFDIRALREEQIRLNNKIQALEAEKAQKTQEELKADAVTSEILKYPHLMHELDKPTLIRNMHRLREKVSGLDRDKGALEGALRQAKEYLTEFAALKKEHAVLQGAHQEQTKYLQKMQGKINQITTYQETIKTQEKVIAKMQNIVEAKMRAKNALPFLPKNVPANAMIPVPTQPQETPQRASLPDFEALQAAKMNEEALEEARREIAELTEKVQDLEHQMYEAKLNQLESASAKISRDAAPEDSDAHSEEGSDSGGEEVEAPNTSVMQEMTVEERAKFEDLKSANEKIDELEAEITAKSYRISALEAQLESSTRDYSREIARLRTKLFELEITAAMANDRPGSSAGDDDYMDMDMNLDALLNIPDPGASKNPPPPSPPAPQPSSFSAPTTQVKSSRPSSPPEIPTSPVPMSKASRPQSAGETYQQSPSDRNTLATPVENSRPPSGSARAAAVSLKSNSASTAALSASPEKDAAAPTPKKLGKDWLAVTEAALDKAEAEVKKAAPVAPSASTPKLAATEIPAEAATTPKAASAVASPVGSPKPASEVSQASLPKPASETSQASLQKQATKDTLPKPDSKASLAGSAAPEGAKTRSGSPVPDAHKAASEGEKSAAQSRVSSTTSLPHVPTHPVAQHPPHEDEPLHRVPKFRRKSGEDNGLAPKLGIGPEGPQDPDAIDKTMDVTMEIIDADQTSPRAGATIRTKKDNQIVLAMMTMTLNFHYDHIRRVSTFKILKIKLHGYSADLLQNRFDPYLKLSLGSKWHCVTGAVKSEGTESKWEFDPESGFFDKKFAITDAEMNSGSNATFSCVVKKKNDRAHEDFECGSGNLAFTKVLFGTDPA